MFCATLCGMPYLIISPQRLRRSISLISRHRWGKASGNCAETTRHASRVLTEKPCQIATCKPAVAACGNDAVHMRREAILSVNDDISRTAPIKWNDVATATRVVQAAESEDKGRRFYFSSFAPTLCMHLAIFTHPRVRQKMISRVCLRFYALS